MDPAEIVLFLGAGASLPLPAGSPLFAEVRDSCAKRAGVDTAAWPESDPRQVLLSHLIPEVFLKGLLDAGYDIEPALRRAMQPARGAVPNAVHHMAAEVLAAGGTVWTTNWDCWVETAFEALSGTPMVPAVYGYSLPATTGGYGKLHGCVNHAGSLRFSSPHVLQPLDGTWHERMVASCRGRRLFVVGYGGADVDLYPALAAAILESEATYWFEGVRARTAGSPAEDELADYVAWRFELDDGVADPADLPASGHYLVWCGANSSASDPSTGLRDALGSAMDVGPPPAWPERFDQVWEHVRAAKRENGDRGSLFSLSASVRERLADRRGAAIRYACAIVVGRGHTRRKAVRSIGNLVLLRDHQLRILANRAYTVFGRGTKRATFYKLQLGEISHDASLARKVASDPDGQSIDTALNSAMSGRWVDDLATSENIARSQLTRALAQDLESRERDWPERVSRSTYELAQSLLWQGRFNEAENEARTAYMRVSGAKWAAWEYTIRGTVAFNRGEFCRAFKQFVTSIEILELEGFSDFTLQSQACLAACARMTGDLALSKHLLEKLERHPRKSHGSVAYLVTERAEVAVASGAPSAAIADWQDLAAGPLPIWRGVGHLRLAETSDDLVHAQAALAEFTSVGCLWGIYRTRAKLEGWSTQKLHGHVQDLGPTPPFVPGAPWLL